MTYSFSYTGVLSSDVYPDQRKRSRVARDIGGQFTEHFGTRIAGEAKVGINRMTEAFHLQCQTQDAGRNILTEMKVFLDRLLKEANSAGKAADAPGR